MVTITVRPLRDTFFTDRITMAAALASRPAADVVPMHQVSQCIPAQPSTAGAHWHAQGLMSNLLQNRMLHGGRRSAPCSCHHLTCSGHAVDSQWTFVGHAMDSLAACYSVQF